MTGYTTDDTHLAAQLKELADAPAPPMTLDLDRARQVGRRRRRLRTASVVAGCTAVVLGVGLAVPALVGSGDRAPNVAASRTEATPGIDTTRSPLVAYASFGWLPDSIVGVGYTMGAHGDTTVARGIGELPPLIWLSTYDSEPESVPQSFGSVTPVRVPTTVDDQKAYWLTTNERDPLNAGDSYLRWQVADGHWAEIHAYYLDGPDLQQVLRRVAADVAVGERAVPLPLRVSSLPESFLVSDAMLSRPALLGTGEWELQLAYTVDGASVVLDVWPQGAQPKPRGAACVTENGLDACAQVNRSNVPELDRIEGLQGLLDRVTLLGMDEDRWVTRVVG
jgi:hypothetical protein